MFEPVEEPSFQIRNYFIRLLCETKPVLDKRILFDRLKTIDDRFKILGEDDLSMFVNERYSMMGTAGNPGSPILVCEAQKINRAELEVAVEHTRDWPGAATAVRSCEHAVLINDMDGHMLRPKDRLENLQKVLAAVLQVMPVRAVHWPAAERIANPAAILSSLAQHEYDNFANGAVNVRFFGFEEGQNEFVMDTLGMAYFKLPDFQCHFRQLDPKEVVACLYRSAGYLFDHGDIIDSGNTIDGCDGSQWQCRREWSLTEPKRQVIDLHAGQFAAGRR